MPKITPTAAKLRGGFYTPEPIATFLSDWAVTKETTSVLEPSCGDGAFIEAVCRRAHGLGRVGDFTFLAAEADPAEATIARSKLSASLMPGRVLASDFFAGVASEIGLQRYDAILGNPPFIRFQYFPEAHRERAFALMRELGFTPSRLTNAWVPFVAIGASLLSEHGRLAMVVPAELLQVSYAAPLRSFLASRFERLTIIAFRSRVFPDVEQEVVLLLAEAGHRPGAIQVIELEGVDELRDRSVLARASSRLPLNHSTDKWTQYFLSEREFALIRSIRESSIPRFGDLASVDVGVVTGNNDFFVLEAISEWRQDLDSFLSRIVHRSSQLCGLELTDQDWARIDGTEEGRLLLTVSNEVVPDGRLAEYIALGERRGVNLGYKCRIRRRWHVVPSVHRPDAFLLRQIHLAPRLSLNGADATSTDTVHRVRLLDGVRRRSIVGSFHSSLTFAFAELVGRSYGGGVLELEPTEAEQLPVAYTSIADTVRGQLDAALRAGEVSRAAELTDEAVGASLGLTTADLAVLRDIWHKLRQRRMKRGRSSLHELAESA
jgi:adenine-specific DNA-methyltransferase